MRHRASLLASMEGISRATFLIAKELSQNSRSGLTARFLSKKLELSIEEVEYLVDVNHKLLYTDLTKVRLAPEGFHAVKRILEGLESHGDVTALQQRIRNLPDQDLQRLEERLGLEEAPTKKELLEQTLSKIYQHPDAVLNYVASREFSTGAREVFDILWQSKDGVMPITQIYALHGGAEYEIEQALWELFQGCSCFELFRFDAENRLMRVAALLKEIRDFNKAGKPVSAERSAKLRPVKGDIENVFSTGLGFSETICRLTAAIAARPARLRNDGELFLEDKRRLGKLCEGEDSLLSTYLWVAEGLGWIARVDNTLRAGVLEEIAAMSRLKRHRLVYDWLAGQETDSKTRQLLENAFEEMKAGSWYRVMDFLNHAKTITDQSDAPQLKRAGAHFEYIAPSASANVETRLARVLEETYFWAGIIDRGHKEGAPCFRISELGDAMLREAEPPALAEHFPEHKGSFVVQPNYEIVAAVKNMDPLMTVPLESFAERVSVSQVVVYRLTREAFLRAMQEGRNADVFIDFLLHNSRESLPENVLITLKDWRGGAKQVRLRTWHVVESDDPLVIAELEHHRRWRDKLNPIDAHKAVRYQGMTRTEIKRALEKDGYIVK